MNLWWLLIPASYALGTFPTAHIVAGFVGHDPTSEGSGNPGATNVLRISNKLTAATVLFLDILKGTVPVWGAYFLKIEPLYLGVIGVAACLGHMYPVFFNFKGGKAVATALGTLLPIGFTLVGLLILTWVVVVKFSRYSSLAAIVTVSIAPLYVYFLKPLYVYPTLMLSALIVFRHRENIKRLIKGTESKITHKI